MGYPGADCTHGPVLGLIVAYVTSTQSATFAVILSIAPLHARPRPHQWVGAASAIMGVEPALTVPLRNVLDHPRGVAENDGGTMRGVGYR